MTTAQHETRTVPRWTAAEIETLRRHVAAGLTNRMIADRHQRSIPSVLKQLRRQGLVTRDVQRPREKTSRWTPERDAWLRELVAAGCRDSETAERMNDREPAIRYRRWQLRLRLVPVASVQASVTTQDAPQSRETHETRIRRNSTIITRLVAPVPAGLVLRDVVKVLGRELTVINYNPDLELVCVDLTTHDVVVVANPDGDVVAVVREVGVEVVMVRQS